MYHQFRHMMDKEEPVSSSGGSIGMVNMTAKHLYKYSPFGKSIHSENSGNLLSIF
ncbi:hypothetical protein RDI58_028775 [Solanum bulbocastanum]|uniref:Uncharacterized protein n=1 Tax=Solanum bulbocastanum TaxID=147425 RepID=A0AAN8SVK1_SOLBU